MFPLKAEGIDLSIVATPVGVVTIAMRQLVAVAMDMMRILTAFHDHYINYKKHFSIPDSIELNAKLLKDLYPKAFAFNTLNCQSLIDEASVIAFILPNGL